MSATFQSPALLIGFTLLTSCAFNLSVYSDSDAGADFSQPKTFSLGSQTEIADPDFHELLGLTYSAAVVQQMLLRGYVISDNPDILINVSVDVEDKTRVPSRVRGCPSYVTRNDPATMSFYGNGKESSTFCRHTEGSIKIDVVDLELMSQRLQ